MTAVGPGAATTALGYVASNDTKVTLFKDYTGATFGAGNSLVGVAFSAVIEVQ